MKVNFKYLLAISCVLPALLLSGCASINSDFDCPMKPGGMCKSLDHVNAMVDRGELGTNQPEADCVDCDKTGKGTLDQKESETNSGGISDFKTPFPSKIGVQPGKPLRYSETVLQIWLAPYEDTQGNYHQESDVFTVVKPGHWIGSPVKALISDEE